MDQRSLADTGGMFTQHKLRVLNIYCKQQPDVAKPGDTEGITFFLGKLNQ